MKMVLAFVQPHKLDAVTRALEHVADFHGMSVSRCGGFGRERFEETPAERDAELGEFTPKMRIETVVRDEQVEGVMRAIGEAAHTGRYGDGMVFVLPVERAFRVMNLREGEEEL